MCDKTRPEWSRVFAGYIRVGVRWNRELLEVNRIYQEMYFPAGLQHQPSLTSGQSLESDMSVLDRCPLWSKWSRTAWTNCTCSIYTARSRPQEETVLTTIENCYRKYRHCVRCFEIDLVPFLVYIKVVPEMIWLYILIIHIGCYKIYETINCYVNIWVLFLCF